MRVLLSLVVLVGWAALARAQDAEREAAQKAWRQENGQGVRLFNAGRHAEALACFERAVPLGEKGFGRESPEVAASLSNLGTLHRVQGQYARARPVYQRALAIYEKARGPDHPDTGD